MTADTLQPPTPRVAAIFGMLGHASMSELDAALARLDEHPAHPYIARRLSALFHRPPFRSTTAQGLWTRIACQLYRHADASTLAELEPLRGRYREIVDTASMGAWLGALLDELVLRVAEKLTPAPAADADRLARAANDALDGGRRRAALEQLSALFAATRRPLVGEAIESLDPPGAPGGRWTEAAWLAAIEASPAAAPGLAPVLAGLAAASRRRLNRGLELLCARPPDPRIATAVIDALVGRLEPLRGIPALRAVVAIRRHGDSRHLHRLRAAAKELRGLAHATAALAERLAALAPGEPTEPIARLEARLAARAPRAGDEERLGQELLAAVLADPADLDARLVYADWLQERGRPRGELIALQHRDAEGRATGAERRRIAALLREHSDRWLGPLRPLVDVATVRFERGFPTALRVRECAQETFDMVAGDAVWATVAEVDFPGPPTPPRGGMTHEVMRSLRAVGGLAPQDLIELIERRPARLDALGVVVGLDTTAVESLSAALRRATSLRRLVMVQRGREDLFVPLLLRGAFARLEALHLGYRHLKLSELLVDVEHHLPALERLVLETSNPSAGVRGAGVGWVSTFLRDDGRRFARVEARFRPDPRRPLAPQFRQLERNVLPKLGRALTTLTVELLGRRRPDVEERVALVSAARRLHPRIEIKLLER